MRHAQRRQRLTSLLADLRPLWHPQPFREARPVWCDTLPGLAAQLLALEDQETEHLASDGAAARTLLLSHVPELEELELLEAFPKASFQPLRTMKTRWDWEVPGRKQAQICAFAGAISATGQPVVDWCGGKGHLGRLLALQWDVPVTSLDIDAELCRAGGELARRSGASQVFRRDDALVVEDLPAEGQHLVALHACGELHRRALVRAAEAGAQAIDLAPCCYHRGVKTVYQPLVDGAALPLGRDDIRLAVTETVTASPRLTRQRDREMAWKLGFDAWRRQATGEAGYHPFKPVPAAWFAGDFARFLDAMARRAGLTPPANPDEFEQAGWRRQREVMRFSILRHAFRRALEAWLMMDLALYGENRGYEVTISSFCPRSQTPRNLLLSAR